MRKLRFGVMCEKTDLVRAELGVNPQSMGSWPPLCAVIDELLFSDGAVV